MKAKRTSRVVVTEESAFTSTCPNGPKTKGREWRNWSAGSGNTGSAESDESLALLYVLLRRRNGFWRCTDVGGDLVRFTPPIEFTLVAHDVVRGVHLESGSTALSLGNGVNWYAWTTFGHMPNELFGDLRLSWGIEFHEVVIGEEYTHFTFHTTDVNKYTLIPKSEMSVYIGKEWQNVTSFVQWNHVQRFGENEAYVFGVRAKVAPLKENGTTNE